jgi:hypothetical protein
VIANAATDWITLQIISVCNDTIIAEWDVGRHKTKMFDHKTRKGERVVFGIVVELVLSNNTQTLQVNCFYIIFTVFVFTSWSRWERIWLPKLLEWRKNVETDSSLRTPPLVINTAFLHENHQVLCMLFASLSLRDNNTDFIAHRGRGAPFRVVVQKHETQSKILAMIDHHKEGLIKLGNAFQVNFRFG